MIQPPIEGIEESLNIESGHPTAESAHHDAAFIYYFKALDLDPDHTSAREYLGELYVKLGQIDKAREQLARLERLCPQGCEERDDLAAAIAKAGPPR